MRERIDAWFMRRLFVPAYEMAPRRARGVRPADPRASAGPVDGYAESLNFLATIRDRRRQAQASPQGDHVVRADRCTDSSRDAIEQAFGARVFDKYGSREFSGIAYECAESRDHHVMDESYIVELLVDGRLLGPGETGEVVITDLNNFSVPLIRYRIGDLAVAVEQIGDLPVRPRTLADRAHRGPHTGDRPLRRRHVAARHLLRAFLQGLRVRDPVLPGSPSRGRAR